MNKFIHGPAVAGQSVVDRVLAAKHTVAGQSLAKVICKATTEEIMGPKRKHLDYLLQCTNEANVSIPEMANLLIERAQSTNWVVVFKALITVHNLMNYGNERFTQYLASSNCSFNLSGFSDRSGTQGYEMSSYIRRYSRYINEKALCYRLMAFDFCKVKRGKEDGVLRTMNTEKLLRTLPVLQAQLDALIEFDVSASELTNGVINAAFMLLFKDLIRLFACYNDGIINLLEKFFEMNRKNCKEGLDIYRKFLVRMDKVCDFLKVAENVGIDKGDIPDLTKAPASLLEALEQHLASLEGNKKAGVQTAKTASGVSVVISTYAEASQFGSTLSTIAGLPHVSDDERRYILEEEQRQLDQMKKKLKELRPHSPTAASKSIADVSEKSSSLTSELFAVGSGNSHLVTQVKNEPSSMDLSDSDVSTFIATQQPESVNFLMPLGSPDVMSLYYGGSSSVTPVSYPLVPLSQPAQMVSPMWNSQSITTQGILPPTFTATLKQSNNDTSIPVSSHSCMQPQNIRKPDLDSSLASLAGNLNLGSSAQIKKTEHQWFDTNEKRLTGNRSTWNSSLASSSLTSQMSQSQATIYSQPSSSGWIPSLNSAYCMPTNEPLSPFNIQQNKSDDPFGSL